MRPTWPWQQCGELPRRTPTKANNKWERLHMQASDHPRTLSTYLPSAEPELVDTPLDKFHRRLTLYSGGAVSEWLHSA